MKLTRLSVALIILAGLLAVAFLGGCAKQQTKLSYEQLITRAEEHVAKAEAAKVPGDKIDLYTEAQKDFQAATGKATEPRQEARALYGLAASQQDLAKVPQDIGEQNKSLWAAHATFTTILTKFGKNTASYASEVQKVVEQTRVRQVEVSTELDKRNSKFKFLGIINFYAIMDFLVKLTHSNPAYSYALAILMVTIIVKLLITPLTKMQFKAMKEMQKISPLVKQIQEKYKGDQTTIGQKTMDLYKEHHINPFASCLPMLIQMPVLLMLYQMIRMYQFQFQKGTFLWIGSALSHQWSVPAPMGGADVWITARNLSEPDLILLVLYVASMYISTKLSSVDPTQADQQKMMAIMMPVMFAVLFATFQSAFLLYWLVFNVIQTIQQYLILHRHDEPALATAPAPPEKPDDDDSARVRRRRRRR